MSITAKTRKILWARSGNRCAICRCELVVEGTTDDPTAIVGDESHIISKQPKGPRSNFKIGAEIDLDGYDNLILLCKTDHTLVDVQEEKFSVQRLLEIKAAHEKWVCEALGLNHPTLNEVTLLPRIKDGKELVNIVRGYHFFRSDHDQVKSQEEMELVSAFIRNIQEWGDILDAVDAGESVRVGFALHQQLEELEQKGFLVFGARQYMKMNAAEVDTWAVATILVKRESNLAIHDLPE
jgi:hypothetical protein